MPNKQVQLLAEKIKELHNAMTPADEYNLDKHIDNVQQYDDLVDEIVELTEGKANAFYTDPVLCDDFTAVTGKPCNSLTYNELCEAYGSLTFGG